MGMNISGKAVVATAAILVAGSATVASAAYDAVNADKVDGKHAVGSSASTSSAAGRLVAHDSAGRLPAKFIPKVNDANRLDGLDSTAFLRTTGKAADASLLDGLDSTSFLLTTGTAANSTLLDGRNATDFLAANGKAADADQLDGLNSTDFLRATGTATDSAKLGGNPAADYLRKCQNGTVHGRAEIAGAQASTATWDTPGVSAGTSWICTGEAVRVRKVATGHFQVVFGSIVHGDILGYGSGAGPLPLAVSKESGKVVSAYGPNQCAPGNPPSPYVICYTVQMTTTAGAATDGNFTVALN